MPRLHVDDNPHLVSPGVKWGVQPSSFTHCTEFFGPVLGVMRPATSHEAIDLVNATGYGLTSGLESLDDREHQLWQEGIRAGNLYINRPTTGAIVLRQPFGGMGKSAFGPGIKAGGPNYVAPLMRFDDRRQELSESGVRPSERSSASPGTLALAEPRSPRRELSGESPRTSAPSATPSPTLHPLSPLAPDDRDRLAAAIDSYLHWAADEFDAAHDHFRLIGEDNFRRYLPIADLRIRVARRRQRRSTCSPAPPPPAPPAAARSSAPAGTCRRRARRVSTCSTR